jgi:hypothetical protein
LVFKAVVDNGGAEWQPYARDAISMRLQATTDQVVVSCDNLKRLGCVSIPEMPYRKLALTPLGSLLANALSP